MNQTLLNMLRSLEAEITQRKLEYLPELLQAYNNTTHGSTGYTPSFLMFGRCLSQPVDVGLGMGQPQLQYDMEGWLHHGKLSFAYEFASKTWQKLLL